MLILSLVEYLTTNGKIGDLLINSKNHFDFIAPEFLRIEIRNHYPKLMKVSGLTMDEIQEVEFQIYKDIAFISEEQIKINAWLVSEKLVEDVDIKDISYIAFSKHFRCKIWSGDKALVKGLAKKGFTNFITTNQLFDLRNGLNQ